MIFDNFDTSNDIYQGIFPQEDTDLFDSKHRASAKREPMHYSKWMFIVCFKIFKQFIWTVFNKYTRTRKRSIMEIKESEDIQDILIERVSFLKITLTIQEGTKTRRFIFCPFGSHSEYLAQLFQRYHPGTFISKRHCE